jgi:hypothetical protein
MISVSLAYAYQPFCGTDFPFFGPEEGQKIFFQTSARQHYSIVYKNGADSI